jgi:hypothetical protein
MTIHHVDMDEVGSGGFNRGDLDAELGKVSGENRCRDLNFLGHVG